MSYNSKYFDRKPGSLENAVLEALGGQINEASVTTDLDDDPKLFKQIERMGVKVKKNGKPQDGYQEVTLSGPQAKIDAANKKLNLLPEAKDMDKVNPDAVKKKFDDRKDKDIDNDGDVDSSDEYLHKRRKAISKAVSKEEKDDFKPHMMYDPKTGKGYKADTMDDHLRMKKMGYGHEAPKNESTEIVEGKMKELAGKIASVYKKMKSDSKMKPFADKFRADVKTSMNIKKSLEKVLPDYVGGGNITKLMGENFIGTPETTKARLDATPGQSSDDWNEQVGIMQKKNTSMREALAKVWGFDEGKNPFEKEEGKQSNPDNFEPFKKKGAKKEDKTMTGKPATKVSVDPDMKEKKN